MSIVACKWPECERAFSYRGFCDMHARRAKSLGVHDEPWVAWQKRKEMQAMVNSCEWPSCSRRVHAQGFCTMHYQRAKKAGNFDNPWVAWNPERKCQWCGVSFISPTRRAIFCSLKCNNKSFEHHNPEYLRDKNRKRRFRIRSTRLEKFTESDVRLRSGDDCYICGSPIDFELKHPDPMCPSLDHIMPVSKGGSHTLDNVAMTHLRCNQRKSATVVNIGPQFKLF